MPQYARNLPLYKALFIIGSIFFLILAIARPQFGERTETIRKEGIEIMIALDISNSMLAEDIAPSRLERSKYALSQLIDKLKNDKLGLVAFAGDAFIQLPMTHDYSAAKLFVSTISPDLISEQGTSIGSAISLASTSFTTDSDIGKAIIIITDGEDHEGNAMKAAKEAHKKGIQIFTIGMGLEKGAPIPSPRQNGEFIKDEAGNTVISKLNPTYLQEVASAANGTYIQASNTNVGLDDIFSEINRLNTETYESTEFTAHAEQYQYFLAISIILLIIGILFPERRHTSWAKYSIFKVDNQEKILKENE
ncbi:VWA domain-containing protein [Balneicella halophila]|nr:VWA domain-containing protein [Balneicella halophila]